MKKGAVAAVLGAGAIGACLLLFQNFSPVELSASSANCSSDPQTMPCIQNIIATLLNPVSPALSERISAARAQSPLKESSASREQSLEQHLNALIAFVSADLSNNITLYGLPLLSNTPIGSLVTSPPNYVSPITLNDALNSMLWLTDNSLYGAAAMKPYSTNIAAAMQNQIEVSWNEASIWKKAGLDSIPCADSANGYAAGILPYYDSGARPPANCPSVVAPPAGERFLTNQAPNPPTQSGFTDTQNWPWLGGDFDDSGHVPVKLSSTRDFFKYGVLREVLLCHQSEAQSLFNSAMATWNGYGFEETRGSSGATQIYYGRDLAFALVAANALGGSPNWSTTGYGGAVASQDQVENIMWTLQQSSGGLPAVYYAGQYAPGKAPKSCKQIIGSSVESGLLPYVCTYANVKVTEEVSPLALLAYGPNIWSNPSRCAQ